MRVCLNVVAGPQIGRTYSFDEHDTFMIGRSKDVQFCLPHDPFFSRHHCLIEIAPPQAYLRDLGSTNGTYVNGQRVESTHLKSGDRIQGGETVLQVEVLAVEDNPFNSSPNFNSSIPSIDTISCLKCATPVEIQTAETETHVTIICDSCRAELLNNPEPVPRHQTIRILGQGGMGSVVLARSETDGRAVAIKTLLPEVAVSEQSMKRFLREIEVASALRHPNIVGYIEHGTHNGIAFLVTEFVDGMDASHLAKLSGGRVNYKVVVQIIAQTLDALDYAHSMGFVHRDIKEQNILIEGKFPTAIAKLTDFGLSKSFQQTGMSGVTMVGDVAGTIAYMPPEQVRDFKEVRPPSDIYAVGMTAYSLLTGTNALDIGPNAGIAETIKAIFENPTIPLRQRIPEIPVDISSVIETALSKRVESRWRSAGAMRQALLNAAERS